MACFVWLAWRSAFCIGGAGESLLDGALITYRHRKISVDRMPMGVFLLKLKW
jgi:hypothetical protein